MDIIYTISLSLVTAVVIGMVQVLKALGLPTRWCPLSAVALGVLATLSLSLFEATTSVVLTGLVIGLTAVGLYSGVRATAGK